MGVPITFLDKWCPEQFEIVGARTIGLNDKVRNKGYATMIKSSDSAINGKCVYARIPIRRKRNG